MTGANGKFKSRVLPVVLLVVLVVAIQSLWLPDSAASISASEPTNTCTFSRNKKQDYCSIIESNCEVPYFAIAKYYYCSKRYPSLPILLLISILIFAALAVILVSLSILVTNCLFANIHELTTTLKINNDILGFVLIPLTNAVPDLVNYYIILDSGSNDLVLGQIIGSILIMLTVIVGTISILNHPFQVVHPNSLMIDMSWVFFILVVFSYIMFDSKVTLVECVVMISGYILYIVFLNFYDKEKHSAENDLLILNDGFREPYSLEDALHVIDSPGSVSPLKSPIPGIHQSFHDNLEYLEDVLTEDSVGILQLLVNAVDILCLFLVPISSDQQNTEWWFVKYHNSNTAFFKVWFCIQIPLLLNYHIFNLDFINLIPIVFVTILVVLMSEPYVPAKIRTMILNCFGISNSTIIISIISKLVLMLLKNFGLLWRISDYLLGLFVFSISNSINDIITNVTISTRINPILGMNACLGTPLLLILLGLGFNGLLIILKNRGAPIRFNLTMDVSISMVALILIIAAYIVYLPMNKWVMDKRMGYIGISGFFAVTFINLLLKYLD